MLIELYGRIVGVAEWGWPIGVLASSWAAVPRMFAQADATDGSLTNTQWTMIALGVTMVSTKIVESILAGYEKYRVITDKSEHGKLAAAINEMTAQKEAHVCQITRMQNQIDALTADYESRIKTKRDETEYLRLMIEATRESEQQLRASNDALTATVVQQNESIARLAHRSVDNTADAIKKITTPVPASTVPAGDHAPITVVAVDATVVPCDPAVENNSTK